MVGERKKLLKLNGESLANRRKEVNVPSCASTQQSFVFIGPEARLFQDVFRPFICPAIRHCPRVPGFLRNSLDPQGTLRYTTAWRIVVAILFFSNLQDLRTTKSRILARARAPSCWTRTFLNLTSPHQDIYGNYRTFENYSNIKYRVFHRRWSA